MKSKLNKISLIQKEKLNYNIKKHLKNRKINRIKHSIIKKDNTKLPYIVKFKKLKLK